VFPVRYGLNLYILFGRNAAFKGLKMTSVCPEFKNAELRISYKQYILYKIKGKVVPVYLFKHYVMKTYGGVEVQLHLS
jgi:hypothetical protein